MNTKVCLICKEPKELSDYEWQNKAKSYLHSWCKPCRRQKTKEYRASNVEGWRKYQRDYSRKRRIANPEKVKAQELRQRCTRYGVTVEWYQEQMEKQSGVCALCLKPEISERRKGSTVRSLAIDHCHADGTARGLLCAACNQAVGKIEAAPGWLERAARYLSET